MAEEEDKTLHDESPYLIGNMMAIKLRRTRSGTTILLVDTAAAMTSRQAMTVN